MQNEEEEEEEEHIPSYVFIRNQWTSYRNECFSFAIKILYNGFGCLNLSSPTFWKTGH